MQPLGANTRIAPPHCVRSCLFSDSKFKISTLSEMDEHKSIFLSVNGTSIEKAEIFGQELMNYQI